MKEKHKSKTENLKKKKQLGFILLMVVFLALNGCSNKNDTVTDYSGKENWVYYGEGEGDADVFFICPTVDMGENGNYNMSLDDEEVKESFVGASNMELGIYDDNAVVYEPYYQQVAFTVYSLDDKEAEPYFEIAYRDVKAAFERYLEVCDNKRPLILAGFSQGADMIIRLLKEFGNEDEVSGRLVAAYAIGWRLTREEVRQYPWLIPAEGEDDTGCIVLFSSEAPDIDDSMIVPEGTWTYSINPLNWKTDSTLAEAVENLGACFTDYSGAITSEIPELTGAYIDYARGTLKCVDIEPADYTNSLFPDGVYHLYDYEFFYSNLKKNVATRLKAYQDSKS